MKYKRVAVLYGLMFCLMVCMTGCVVKQPAEPQTSVQKSTNPTKQEIVIYQMDRDTFIDFINAPDVEFLSKQENYTYNSVGQRHNRGSALFSIEQELFDFVLDEQTLCSALKENHIEGEIKHIAVIDPVSFPMTIWAKVGENNIYFSIDEYLYNCEFLEEEPEQLQFVFYTEQQFRQRYNPKQATLIVNGNEVACDNAPRLYDNDTIIPFITVLEKLGFKVTWQNETLANAEIKGEQYIIDVKEMRFGRESVDYENLLNLSSGGPCYIHPVEKDLMLDDNTLRIALRESGLKCEILTDWESGKVTIIT
jgi:hypothetical protein